ncbi:uncharacterized protein LOC101856412 [Aplysia californica]|uniref:Uncharacterized protein LOC101856412 n=1 Tax=Aplysia californica TaxID=6500 RepID=A0ABM0ZWL7_APLCA|nr:uncharacterized protein LOC101856412 [Aplysia californica]
MILRSCAMDFPLLVEWIYFVSLLCLAGKCWGQASSECIDGLQICTNSYVQAARTKPEDGSVMCREVNIFGRCIKDLDCEMPKSARDQVIENLSRELANAGISCHIDLDGVTTRKPVSTIPPEFSTKPTTCEAVANACVQNYMNSIFSTVKENPEMEGKQWQCPLIVELISCIMDSPCDKRKAERWIRERVEKESRKPGYQCDIDLTNLRKREDNRDQQGDSSKVDKYRTDTDDDALDDRNSGPPTIFSPLNCFIALTLWISLFVDIF